jgi:transcriptional regulator with XRE-family HTH domain
MPKDMDLGPSPIDVHVGQRVRLRRNIMGLSQQRLAQGLGITFQQVQKYERGANRISASKLYEIARIIQVPIGFFFEGLDDPASPAGYTYTAAWSKVVDELFAEADGPALVEAFLRIRRRSVRKAFANLAGVIAANDQADEAGDLSAAE